MTLLMFIWTVSCFRLMANTTSVSHGDPCWPADFPFFPKAGVDVLANGSEGERSKVRRKPAPGRFDPRGQLPVLGADESDTLRVRPGAGDLRCPRPPGDMLECSEKTLGDCGACDAAELPSHVLQYAFRLDSGDRCWAMLSAESGVAGPEAAEGNG